MSQKVVAVFGSTGGQGASVARALARHRDQYMVRALTRSTGTQHAQKIRQDGADLIVYDPFDPLSIQSALAGAYAVFVNTVTDYNDPNCLENEKKQGRLIADACKQMGVRHVVFSSQIHVARVSGAMVRHMVAKAETEDYMHDIGLPVTCLIMPIYYEDLCDVFRPVTRDGSCYELLIPTGLTPIDMMSVEDLGPVILKVLSDPGRYVGKTLSVSGDKLTMREVAFVLCKHLGSAGKTFKDKQLTVHEFCELQPNMPGVRDWAQMFNFLVREDQRRQMRDTRELNPNMQSFEAWVANNVRGINSALSC